MNNKAKSNEMDNDLDGTVRMAECYNSNSSPQLSAIESSIPFIRQAIDVLDVTPSSSPLIIADFGSAQGANSVCAMKAIIEYLQESQKDLRLPLVIHNDLPTNDWAALFNILSHENSYFGLACGRSFYDQCLPSNSVTIAYSSSSIHWLSRKPCNLSNHCSSVFAQGDELEKFKTQAHLDYDQFLKHRSHELVTGGVLILGIICHNDQGIKELENSKDLLYKCAQKLPLTEEELLNYTISSYIRSYEECVDYDLFQKHSFQLINSDHCQITLKFFQKWKQGQITVEQVAEAHTQYMRGFNESLLKQALQTNGKRSNEQIEQLSNQFWILYQQEIFKKPDEYNTGFY